MKEQSLRVVKRIRTLIAETDEKLERLQNKICDIEGWSRDCSIHFSVKDGKRQRHITWIDENGEVKMLRIGLAMAEELENIGFSTSS